MAKTEIWNDTATEKMAIAVFLRSTGQIAEYRLKNENTIGRISSTGSVDISVDSPLVSRNHGQITIQSGLYYYQDLSSTNGTYINGILLGRESKEGRYRTILRMGDVLRIDHKDLEHPHENAVLLVTIRVSDDRLINKSLDLKTGHGFTVGRTTGNVRLDSREISEKHAVFLEDEKGKWYVYDCNSTNGVYVNGERVINSRELSPLDVIRFTEYIFIYTGDRLCYFCKEKAAGQLVINIEERSVRRLLKKQVLLKDINLTINEGEMVMILGGSGAGKTTFMNAVLGYEKARGSIEHDHVNVYKEYNRIKSRMGFVPQQDLLRMEDTVYATLSNAAQMRMDPSATREDRESRIDHVLNSLGLSRERDSMVRKLSGGQRKRLSIAVELIADPALFFLDEPDSGLDGIMAKSLMQQLRMIADEGRIVMVITHAPDRVKELFDKVVILAKGEKDNVGHLAFYGSIPEALGFFDASSLEGVVKKINRVDEGGEGLSDHYIEKYAEYRRGEV